MTCKDKILFSQVIFGMLELSYTYVFFDLTGVFSHASYFQPRNTHLVYLFRWLFTSTYTFSRFGLFQRLLCWLQRFLASKPCDGSDISLTSFVSLLQFDDLSDIYQIILIAVFVIFVMIEIIRLYLGFHGNLAETVIIFTI